MAQRPAREFERRFCSDVPSQRDLDIVAHRAGDNWRSLLTNLGIDLTDIQRLLSKHGNDTRDACFAGLVYWLKGGGEHWESATFETLFEALRDARMAGVVSELVKMLEERLPIKAVDDDKPDRQTQKQANVQQGNRTLQPQTAIKPMKPPAGSTPLQQQASAAPKEHSSNTQIHAKDPSPAADQKFLDHQSISCPVPQNMTSRFPPSSPAYQDMPHARPGQYQGHSSPNVIPYPPSHNAISPPRERLAERMKRASMPIPKLRRTEGPKAFQLPTKQLLHDPTRRLAINYVGTSHRDSPSHKVVMLVGATGAGKTTLINGMANYIYGVRWEDDFRFKLINDEGIFSRAHIHSTKWITAHTLYWDPESALNYDLTVIDIPEFCDTSGADKVLVAQIKDLFSFTPDQHGIDQIHGIGFVTQASLARLTPTQKYVFDSILSIFGTDLGENILLFTTFSDGRKPPVIEAVKAAKLPYCEKGIFKFNNSALFADNRESSSQSSHNHREDSSDEDNFNKMFWKMEIKSFKKFFSHLDDMEVKSLQLTKEVLEERQHLETILNGIQPQIQAGLVTIADLEQIKANMEKLQTAIIANRKYTFTVEVPRITKVDLKPGEYQLICLKCNHTCHYPCDIPSDENKAHCSAMDKDGNCRICYGKCCWNCHRSLTFRFEPITVMEVITSDDLKKKYDDAMSDKSSHETMKAHITKELKCLSRQILAMVCKAQASLKRLEEIALKPNPLTDIQYLELLIESEKYQANKGWMDRVQALKGFLKQAKFLANMRKKGATITTNPLVDDDMFKKTWWEDLMDRWHL